MKGIFKRTFSSFEPADDNAKKILKRCSFGDDIELEHIEKRNVGFHRKFFAILKLTFDNQDYTENIDIFREIVLIHSGYYDWIELIDGSKAKRAKSISFSNMDQYQFEDVYSHVFNTCLKILGCKSEELEKELLRFN
jgi:hypothetical protein